jgi:glycosyltransferase involved in cell wall biosynthesis
MRLDTNLRQRYRLVVVLAHSALRHRLESLVASSGIVGRVTFLNSPSQLVWLYNAAAVFVFPSLYEGFGIPALEAMACGTPVVASNRSSIPEVVGDAALLVDPTQPAEIASAVQRVLTDARLRKELRERGLERAAQFSWERTARETLAVYEACASEATKL